MHLQVPERQPQMHEHILNFWLDLKSFKSRSSNGRLPKQTELATLVIHKPHIIILSIAPLIAPVFLSYRTGNTKRWDKQETLDVLSIMVE